MTEVEAKELLHRSEINVIDTRLATSKKEAVSLAEQLCFPVVLKIVSPDITHKSDAGGVKLNLRTPSEVGEAYENILSAAKGTYPQATVSGVSVQKMAPRGVELIIGMSTDPTFGPMLMFGIGGIFVEILKDVAFRIVPLTEKDAREMIREISGYPLLNGFRAQEPVDVCYLEKLLLRVSRFVEENPEIRELDINPVIAYRNGAVVVDARIVSQESD